MYVGDSYINVWVNKKSLFIMIKHINTHGYMNSTLKTYNTYIKVCVIMLFHLYSGECYVPA